MFVLNAKKNISSGRAHGTHGTLDEKSKKFYYLLVFLAPKPAAKKTESAFIINFVGIIFDLRMYECTCICVYILCVLLVCGFWKCIGKLPI